MLLEEIGMKKRFIAALLALVTLSLMLTGCDLGGIAGGDESKEYNDELESSSGKWLMMGDEDTYFILDGGKDVMSFSYVEDGVEKYNGKYRVVHRGTGEDVYSPMTLIMTRSDKEKEDWLYCYAEDFEENFTQFTVMDEEEDLGFIDGTVYTHVYRMSELPYKMGTYILEGNEYKTEANDYSAADALHIPSGTYTCESGASFTFLVTKPRNHQMFQYKNGEVVVEGSLTIAADEKTVYLYIEHDPYQKVTKADKEHYDTTFSINYPPDFYLRGDFNVGDGTFSINDLYHHSESPTTIEDSTWIFGDYSSN